MQILKLLVTLIIFFLTTISCNSNKRQKIIINKVDTTILQNSKIIETDTFVKNSIDTSQYLGLPYYDTTMYHPGLQGYIDTFTINNYKFRIIHQDTMFDGVVEKYQTGQWNRKLQFERLGNHENYDISKDLNGDRYKDLVFYSKWFGEIHFFDTIKNEFCDTVNCTIGIDWTLLDTSNCIFYENEFGKLMDSPVSSNLFTFKNVKRIDIAKLKITFNPEDEDIKFIKGELYLNENKTLSEKIIPHEKVNLTDFDYQKFWTKRYKKLMGSH